jgi:hypothetical protein
MRLLVEGGRPCWRLSSISLIFAFTCSIASPFLATGLCSTEPGVNVFPGILPITPGNVFPKLPKLHLAILICRADTGVKGATHDIIVHYFRTIVNLPVDPSQLDPSQFLLQLPPEKSPTSGKEKGVAH